jgi:hypothetical protein
MGERKRPMDCWIMFREVMHKKWERGGRMTRIIMGGRSEQAALVFDGHSPIYSSMYYSK